MDPALRVPDGASAPRFLDSDNLQGSQVDLRLVMQDEFELVDGAAQLAEQADRRFFPAAADNVRDARFSFSTPSTCISAVKAYTPPTRNLFAESMARSARRSSSSAVTAGSSASATARLTLGWIISSWPATTNGLSNATVTRWATVAE